MINREEAIKILSARSRILKNSKKTGKQRAAEALDIAIIALKFNPQAAREAIDEIINTVHSQPERPTEDSEECVIAGQCIEHKGELYIRLSDVERCVDRFKKPERPKGRWVCLEAEIGYYACSECDHRILRAKCNYCPNCGADMAELPNCGADMRGEEE